MFLVKLLLKTWTFRTYFICREGSVIADISLTFGEPVGESKVESLLQETVNDGSLGTLKVDTFAVGATLPGIGLWWCTPSTLVGYAADANYVVHLFKVSSRFPVQFHQNQQRWIRMLFTARLLGCLAWFSLSLPFSLPGNTTNVSRLNYFTQFFNILIREASNWDVWIVEGW